MKILITGGLGFIGINSVLFFSKEHEVHIVDNLSRKGNIENYSLISDMENVFLHVKDIRNYHDISTLFEKIKPDAVLHLAGQVAVTTSVKNPREDFDINCIGTFNILETIREKCPECILIFASTNKVYGDYKSELIEKETRYEYLGVDSVNEETPIDFHSPYGCSKGCAEQYVRDYARIYNLRTVVLRQSCIYGPNQFGIEDQGWVAWFTIASIFNKGFYIYGDGKQVRDVLHIDDLINLYNLVINNIDKCSGMIFNVGGGKENSLSLIELLNILKNLKKEEIKYSYSDWRPGDQKIYISDIKKISNTLNWVPNIKIQDGVNSLYKWAFENEKILKKIKII